MNAPLEHPIARTQAAEQTAKPLDIRHLLIGQCGTHSLKANGVYQVARAVADEQKAAGANARLILLREANSVNPDEDSDPELEIVPIDGPKLLNKRIGFTHAVLERLTKDAREGTIFHIHTARQPLLIPLALALGKRGIPYAITVHGRYSHVFGDNMEVKHTPAAIYLKGIERWVLNKARFVQAVAPYEEAVLRQVAPRANIVLVPNAAFSKRTADVAGDAGRAGPSAGFPVFGFLGRYEIEHKGLDLLLDGFGRYKRSGGRGTLQMVGSGPLRAVLLQRAKDLNILESVTIAEPRYGEAKLEALRGWDFFVSPSRFDGLPMATIEAAYLGVPVLVTKETGLKDDVLSTGAGLAIEGLTAEAVTRALFDAEKVNGDAWVKMSAGAQAMARALGDWTEIAGRLLRLYRTP